MPLFSDFLKGKTPEAQRRLYTLFQRAAKTGEFPSLKLLTRFELVNTKGEPRQVFDYALTASSAQRLGDWMTQHEQPNSKPGLTAEQVQAMTDEQLAALIEKQYKPARKRRAKKEKASQQAAPTAPVTPVQVQELSEELSEGV